MKHNKEPKCPSCFSNENFRQELLESCQGGVLVSYCCCGEIQCAKGTLELVGSDFILLEDPILFKSGMKSNNNENEPEALLIPLNRIFAFIECLSPPTEAGCAQACDSDQTLIEHLAEEHCGDFVDIQFCPCFEEDPICIYGHIVEVGCDFVEVRSMLEWFAYNAKPGSAMEELTKLAETLVTANAKKQPNGGPTKDIVLRSANICSVLILSEDD